MELKNYTSKAHLFFDMLPKDWLENIESCWESLKETTRLFVLVENDSIIVGGLVFSKCPPDMMYYEEEAKKWFKKGYLYLGYIFVDEAKRNQNLGSLWLDRLKELYTKQGFWLAIEDESLHKFYVKNGFKRIGMIGNGESQEGIYIFEPPN